MESSSTGFPLPHYKGHQRMDVKAVAHGDYGDLLYLLTSMNDMYLLPDPTRPFAASNDRYSILSYQYRSLLVLDQMISS